MPKQRNAADLRWETGGLNLLNNWSSAYDTSFTLT